MSTHVVLKPKDVDTCPIHDQLSDLFTDLNGINFAQADPGKIPGLHNKISNLLKEDGVDNNPRQGYFYVTIGCHKKGGRCTFCEDN